MPSSSSIACDPGIFAKYKCHLLHRNRLPNKEVEGVGMTPEPNNVAFVQRIENARRFKINPLEEIVMTVPSEPAKHVFWALSKNS